jgi:hypothetical protein
VAVIGWALAFTGGLPSQNIERVSQLADAQLTEIEQTRLEIEQERLRKTVYYGYYNVGSNIACIVSEAGTTPSIEIYAENIYAPDATIDFTLTAKRGADVSLNASDGFQQSATKTLTVLEGTQTLRHTFYLRPHTDANEIQLTLEAEAIEPSDILLTFTLPFSNTVVFFNDGSGNYCHG